MIEEMDKEYKYPVKHEYMHGYEYEVNIDFDGASTAWRSNKQTVGNGSFKYICQAKTKQNNNCKKRPMRDSCFCNIHQHN
jgi:hypothetical protein